MNPTNNGLGNYDTMELGRMLVAFQQGIDTARPGSSVRRFYAEMVSVIATELLNRYRQESDLLARLAG